MSAAILLFLAAIDVLPPSQCVPRPEMTVETLVTLWGRCANQTELEAACRERGEPATPELVTLFRDRPELRRAVLAALGAMGAPGQAAFRQLGLEGVDALARSGTRHQRELLEGLGPEGTKILVEMLNEPDEHRQTFAVDQLRELRPAEALDALLRTMATSPYGSVKIRAAEAAATLAPHDAVPALVRLLSDPTLPAEYRGVVAQLLAGIDDPSALDAVAALLKDPSVERSMRWDVARALEKSGRPGALALARRYGPSGPQGSGNPESPVGGLLAVLALGGSLSALLLLRGAMTRGLRFRLVLAATLAPYPVAFLCASFYFTIGRTLGWATPVTIVVALGLAIATAIWLARGTDRPNVSIAAMSAATTACFLAAILLDLKVNWYLERMNEAYGLFKSPLLLAITLAGATGGSYIRSFSGRQGASA